MKSPMDLLDCEGVLGCKGQKLANFERLEALADEHGALRFGSEDGELFYVHFRNDSVSMFRAFMDVAFDEGLI